MEQTGAEVSVSLLEPEPRIIQATSLSDGPPDRFTYMDFRVRWADDVAYINRGRVHFSAYSPTIDKFFSSSYIIAADEVPLELDEDIEHASVWLSIPFLEREFGGVGTVLRTYVKPDATTIQKETMWSGFDSSEADTRKGLADHLPKFAVATTDLVPTPIAETDFMVHLANISSTGGVSHIHFGSVTLPNGFDAEETRT